MIKVRKYNEKGIKNLKEILISLKSKSNKISKDQIDDIKLTLFDKSLTVEITEDIAYELDLTFSTAMDVGRYHFMKLTDINFDLRRDNGLWTWLCIASLENYLKPAGNNEYILGVWHKYILTIDNYKTYYRHPVYMPYLIYLRFQDGLESKMFLQKDPFISGEFVESFASKQKLFSNDSLITMIAEKVYNQSKNSFPNKFLGKDRKHPSSLGYLAIWEGQISLNFDLFECEPSKIFDLLPKSLIRDSNKHNS